MAELKTLKILAAKDLPYYDNRDSNIIYFCYDTLEVYLGKSAYNDPYAIVEKVPETPITGILYFDLTDGKVKSYIEYSIIDIAKVESKDQLEHLKQTGSTFFVKSDRRYLDFNRRIVTLPFKNGTYELTVTMANDLKIDENTKIYFDINTNMFEIVGDPDDETAHYAPGYSGKETNTIKNVVSDRKIQSDVKLSNANNNILRYTETGLYAQVDDRVSVKQFESWAKSYKEYKEKIDTYLDILNNIIGETVDITDYDSIGFRIENALKKVYPSIDNALAQFDEMSSKFKSMEARIQAYADMSNEYTENRIIDAINYASNNVWESF